MKINHWSSLHYNQDNSEMSTNFMGPKVGWNLSGENRSRLLQEYENEAWIEETRPQKVVLN